jgi:lipoprotein NlpD
VVYSGNGLIGYGNLVIIKHNHTYLSAYGHNRKLLVKEGDRVQTGEQIAEMGQTGGEGSILHFEIRRDGKPVDPEQYLPRRTAAKGRASPNS